MGIPLYVICYFSLAAFNICSLCLIFVNLINMCLGVFCLGFILFGTLQVSWTQVIISFPILGKFSTIISSSIFSWSFFLSSYSGTPMFRMLWHLILSQRSLTLSSFLLICFSLFLSNSFISTILSSTSLILSSASVILLFFPLQSVFHLIYCIISEKAMYPTPVLLLAKSHGWRSLVGCSPWGRKELGTTERLTHI